MSVSIRVQGNTTADLTLSNASEATLNETSESSVLLTAEESTDAVLSASDSSTILLEAEPCIYVGGTGTPYSGPYEVTPKAYEDQVLQTANKHMSGNVTVYEVPYYETSNLSGDTVYIASEV